MYQRFDVRLFDNVFWWSGGGLIGGIPRGVEDAF